MLKSLLAPSLAGLMFVGASFSALAAEGNAEMMALRSKGPGPVIGNILITDTSDGAVLQFSLTEVPPGPNSVFLQDEANCAISDPELLSRLLAIINVSTNDDGALPLRSTVLVPDITLAELSGKALVVYRGTQTASLAPEQVGALRLVACGVVQ